MNVRNAEEEQTKLADIKVGNIIPISTVHALFKPGDLVFHMKRSTKITKTVISKVLIRIEKSICLSKDGNLSETETIIIAYKVNGLAAPIPEIELARNLEDLSIEDLTNLNTGELDENNN